jgi:pimeloyl-ACP methyl ester carboxylesterase
MRPLTPLVLGSLLAAGCVPDDEPACLAGTRPLVLLHGFLASGDTWANVSMRLAANGHCLARTYAFDWNSLGQADPVPLLDAYVDTIRSETGSDRVDLAGHSAGGGLGYRYLAEAGRAAKVAHYVHLASVRNGGPAGPEGAPVPTLNLWSDADTVVRESGAFPGVTNVLLAGQDHYEVATSPESFDAMWRFLHDGAAPATTAIAPQQRITLAGKAVALGDNTPVAGGRVEIWETDPATGARRGEPRATFLTKPDGAWGPFEARRDTTYEFRVVGAGEDALPVHYYREPFQRSNDLVYLRTLPADPGSLVGSFLSGIRWDDAHSVIVLFGANRAFHAATDPARVGDVALPMEVLATDARTTIALFAFDDGDRQSTAAPVDGFGFGVFLAGSDVFVPATAPAAVPLEVGGRTLVVRNWPSATEGATIAVFE